MALRACYIRVAACDVKLLRLAVVLRHLAGLLEDSGLTLVGQNIKFDYKVMLRAGLRMRCRLFDTMVASWLLDSEQGSYGMDGMALRFLNYRTIHYEEVVGKDPQRSLADVPVAEATDYSGEDADITFQLYELFSPRIAALGLEKVRHELEMPLVSLLAEMELVGIRLDVGMDPRVLALDEPTAGLDPRARRKLIRLLGGLPVTMLVSTHDLAMVRELFPRTIVMDEGRLVADGPTRTILADAAFLAAHGLEE